VKRWQKAKRVILFLLLAFAILQFYFMDVFIEMISIGGGGISR
jgi:hypothetical protein